MNFSAKDFVSTENILSDVVRMLDDESYRYNTKGYYTSQVRYALQELAFDTLFDIRTDDFDIPDNLRVPMPEGSFNIREIFVFNGDMCNISSARKVWWKRNYWTGGNGYLARDRGTVNNDPFYQNRSYAIRESPTGKDNSPIPSQFQPYHSSVEDVLFYNVQNGMIMLSPKCRAWQKVAIVYNGIGCNANEAPCVPNFLREPVKLWAADTGIVTRISKSTTPFELQKWRLVQSDIQMKLNGRTNRAYDGAWYNAELRMKQMDKNARQDLLEYFSRLVK